MIKLEHFKENFFSSSSSIKETSIKCFFSKDCCLFAFVESNHFLCEQKLASILKSNCLDNPSNKKGECIYKKRYRFTLHLFCWIEKMFRLPKNLVIESSKYYIDINI